MPSCSRLRYIEARPRVAGDTRRAPRGTLVLLHAFPLSARLWEPQHVLADGGWRVVMPQFRGFDCERPDATDVSSLEDYAHDVADLLETLGVESAVIAGLSMGGYVAFELYRHAPELFSALILADTRADADSADARAARLRMIELAAEGGASAVAAEMVPKLLGETTRSARPEVAVRVRELILATHPHAMQAAVRAMMTRKESVSLLPSIAVPTLVVVGDEDSITPPALARAMADAIPGASLTVVPRAGHLPSCEQPQAFNDSVLSFLGRL
jgi:3-oxoadipate enol-lactonase